MVRGRGLTLTAKSRFTADMHLNLLIFELENQVQRLKEIEEKSQMFYALQEKRSTEQGTPTTMTKQMKCFKTAMTQL